MSESIALAPFRAAACTAAVTQSGDALIAKVSGTADMPVACLRAR